MDSLPEEILRHMARYLTQGAICNLMLSSIRTYLSLRSVLYGSLKLPLRPVAMFLNGATRGRGREDLLLQTLASDRSSSTASEVQHLTVAGVALFSTERKTLLMQALTKTVKLQTLTMALRSYPSIGLSLFTHQLCASPTFLSTLSALDIDDADVACMLVRGRPLSSLRVFGVPPARMEAHHIDSLIKSDISLVQLQLCLEVDDLDDAVARFQAITDRFPQLANLGIALYVSRPPEKPLHWDSFHGLLRRIHPSLAQLHNLQDFQITVYPTPRTIIQEVEKAVKYLLPWCPSLHRLDLGWHIWERGHGLCEKMKLHHNNGVREATKPRWASPTRKTCEEGAVTNYG